VAEIVVHKCLAESKAFLVVVVVVECVEASYYSLKVKEVILDLNENYCVD
jgi:hypothetical protein